MDEKMHNIISVISDVVAALPSEASHSDISKSQTILLKCVSQFQRKKQMHAQEAVHYLRGFKDGVSSHKTTPMMSNILMSHCRSLYMIPSDNDANEDSSEDDESEEQPYVSLSVDNQGRVLESNQFHDYYYRGDTLQTLNFYEFARCVKREAKTNSPKTHRLGTLTRHALLTGHSLAETHQLVLHTNETEHQSKNLIPRMIGATPPRVSHPSYHLFMLAHFKPFSCKVPLLDDTNQSAKDQFDCYNFDARSLRVMGNWEAVHECEDEWEAERIKKSANRAKKVRADVVLALERSQTVFRIAKLLNGLSDVDLVQRDFVSRMSESNWLKSPNIPRSLYPILQTGTEKLFEPVTAPQIKGWKKQMNEIEEQRKHARRSVLNPLEQTSMHTGGVAHGTVTLNDAPDHIASHNHCHTIPATESSHRNDTGGMSPHQLIQSVRERNDLNERQNKAFEIVSNHFIQSFVNPKAIDPGQLIMVLTGPGGTGKTYTVNAVKEVMAYYGQSYMLRFLALARQQL
ncbi:hypothetical protein AAF712_016133 [Marasmius tenuissimus]|uniref:ATP-dependent DNA helicase n=1 Tax=Marasmius tenuissimus TaxID=585030 RepID=A0ABR2Z7I7_9AGAR